MTATTYGATPNLTIYSTCAKSISNLESRINCIVRLPVSEFGRPRRLPR
jgi:hypothetical protein